MKVAVNRRPVDEYVMRPQWSVLRTNLCSFPQSGTWGVSWSDRKQPSPEIQTMYEQFGRFRAMRIMLFKDESLLAHIFMTTSVHGRWFCWSCHVLKLLLLGFYLEVFLHQIICKIFAWNQASSSSSSCTLKTTFWEKEKKHLNLY